MGAMLVRSRTGVSIGCTIGLLCAGLNARVFYPAPRKGIFQQSGLMGGEVR